MTPKCLGDNRRDFADIQANDVKRLIEEINPCSIEEFESTSIFRYVGSNGEDDFKG